MCVILIRFFLYLGWIRIKKERKEVGTVLSCEELFRLEIIVKVFKGELSQREAISILKVSERTLRRYVKAYKERGVASLKHGNTRRPPVNKLSTELKYEVMRLAEEKYFDFNVSHLREKLYEELGTGPSYSTLLRWCWERSLVKNAHKKRRSKPRRARQRRSQEGQLLQLDGSHHYWFGDRFLCLMAAIDDATGEVFAKFYEGETTWACMDFLKSIVLKKGVMNFVYTDRAGLYGGLKREHFSQVERALGELGSHVIYAQSPEGKGRVERLFRTLQDRLVPELRLEGITRLEEANKYLQEIYLPMKHNPKHMVQAENPISSYKPLAFNADLNQTFCVKETRIIGRDHTVSIKAEKWMISDLPSRSLAGARIELRFDQWGEWRAFYASKPLKLIKVKKAKKAA